MNIKNELINMINEAMPIPTLINETSNLYTDLGYDSLEFIQLLMEIEEAYSISIGLMEMELCLQVGELISIVESKVNISAKSIRGQYD